jgi:hypothetical protein
MATLKQLQDSRKALQKEVADLVVAENELREQHAKLIAANAAPRSESQVPEASQEPEEDHQENAIQRVVEKITEIRIKIEAIQSDIDTLLPKGGRRRKTLRRRKHRKTRATRALGARRHR